MADLPHRLSAALAGRYLIERELGRGGMATVYLAEDLMHRRKVAVKVLRPELAATLGPERLLREIRRQHDATAPDRTGALRHALVVELVLADKEAEAVVPDVRLEPATHGAPAPAAHRAPDGRTRWCCILSRGSRTANPGPMEE